MTPRGAADAADGVRLVTGKVVVTGAVSDAVRRSLLTRHRTREVVELWRADLDDLAFLTELPGLRSLSVVNCRLVDTAPLARCTALRTLFLNQARPRDGWDFLARLDQVEELHLLNVRGDLPLPDQTGMTSLRVLRVWGCAGLHSLAALERAPVLESVECVGTGLGPQDFEGVLARPSVRYVSSTFGTRAAREQFATMLAHHGKRAQEHDAP